MGLDSSIAKKFSNTIRESLNQKPPELYSYGKVVKRGDDVFVILDGSDVEMPVELTMDAEDGDRVMVMIKDHLATITGNLSSPASARTATKYMKLTEDGLIIFSDTELSRTIMNNDSFKIQVLDSNGKIINETTFGNDYVNFGNDNDSSSIALSGNRAELGYTNSSLLQHSDSYGDSWVPGNSDAALISYIYPSKNRAKVVGVQDNCIIVDKVQFEEGIYYPDFHIFNFKNCKPEDFDIGDEVGLAFFFKDDTLIDVRAYINLTKRGSTDMSISSLRAEPPGYYNGSHAHIDALCEDCGGVSGITIGCTSFNDERYSLSMGNNDSRICMHSYSDIDFYANGDFTFNGKKVLTNSSPLFKTGTVQYKNDTEVNDSGTYKTFNADVTVPSGYTLVGVTAVNNSSHISAQRLTRFYHSGSKVYASFYFGAKCTGVTITWTWLAIRNV